MSGKNLNKPIVLRGLILINLKVICYYYRYHYHPYKNIGEKIPYLWIFRQNLYIRKSIRCFPNGSTKINFTSNRSQSYLSLSRFFFSVLVCVPSISPWLISSFDAGLRRRISTMMAKEKKPYSSFDRGISRLQFQIDSPWDISNSIKQFKEDNNQPQKNLHPNLKKVINLGIVPSHPAFFRLLL